MWDKMSLNIDQIVIDNTIPIIETYFDKFQQNWNIDNKVGMKTWLNQIESVLTFIGVNKDTNDKYKYYRSER